MSFDFEAHLRAGYEFVYVARGDRWNVTTPDGRHGSGPTPDDAIANVDAQILRDPETGRRVLVRADDTTVWLDPLPVLEVTIEEPPVKIMPPILAQPVDLGTPSVDAPLTAFVIEEV